MKTLDRFGANKKKKKSPRTFFFSNVFIKNLFLQEDSTPFRGGESEALTRLRDSLSDKVRYGFLISLDQSLSCLFPRFEPCIGMQPK